MSDPVHLPSDAYGGFWLRMVAAFLDTVIFMAIEAPFILLAYGTDYYSSWGSSTSKFVEGWVDVLVTWIMPFVVTMLFWRYKRATPAKMLLRMEIVDADTGETPSLLQCVLRYVGYFLSAIPCGIGFLFIPFDERKRGLHDRLANTVVRRVVR